MYQRVSARNENQDEFTRSLKTKSSIMLLYKTRQKDHTDKTESNGFVCWLQPQ